jgi:hypothetical protein
MFSSNWKKNIKFRFRVLIDLKWCIYIIYLVKKQLENELNLGKKDILILRNDILSKYNDC